MIMTMTGGGNPPPQRRDLGLHIEGLTVIQHAAYQYILMFKQVFRNFLILKNVSAGYMTVDFDITNMAIGQGHLQSCES